MKVFKNVALVGLCLFALSFTSLRAQTVIDLKRGGVVRAKTIDDYREEAKVKERLAADSLAYVDHLTRALNALGRDSLAQAEQLFRKHCVFGRKLRRITSLGIILEKSISRKDVTGKPSRVSVRC